MTSDYKQASSSPPGRALCKAIAGMRAAATISMPRWGCRCCIVFPPEIMARLLSRRNCCAQPFQHSSLALQRPDGRSAQWRRVCRSRSSGFGIGRQSATISPPRSEVLQSGSVPPTAMRRQACPSQNGTGDMRIAVTHHRDGDGHRQYCGDEPRTGRLLVARLGLKSNVARRITVSCTLFCTNQTPRSKPCPSQPAT